MWTVFFFPPSRFGHASTAFGTNFQFSFNGALGDTKLIVLLYRGSLLIEGRWEVMDA